MKQVSILCGAILLCAMSLSAEIMGEGGIFDEPEVTEKDLMPASKKPADLTYKIPTESDAFGFNVRLINPGILKVQFETAGDKFKKSFTIKPASQVVEREKSIAESKGKTVTEIGKPSESHPNHLLQIGGKGFSKSYYLLPNFFRYRPEETEKNLFQWEETIPNALQHNTRIELRSAPKGIALYVDGIYTRLFPGGHQLKSVKIMGGVGAEITAAKAFRNPSGPLYEVIDFGPIANPGAMKDARLSIAPGIRTVDGIPMIVQTGAHSSDMSLVKALRGMNFSSERDYYMGRTAWERYPVTQHSAVPNGYYNELAVLFALDPDPAKDRAFSFRMGRFCSFGRVPSWGYTDVVLPEKEENFPPSIRKVGTVETGGKTLPLYLGRFPVDCGAILDLITNDPYDDYGTKFLLDYEFMGRRNLPSAYVDTSHKPNEKRPSAVNIFGVTLRKAGVFLNLIQHEPGNAFYNDDVPETTVCVRCERPGDYSIRWRILDTWGKQILKEGTEPMKFARAGEEKKFIIDLRLPDIGHYLLHLDVCEDGKKVFTHKASFALLGRDTRKADAEESPFGTWWTTSHHGVTDPDVWMKILNKAGIRRASSMESYTDNAEFMKKAEQYNLILNQIPWMGEPPDREQDPAAFEDFMHKKYDPIVKAFPKTKYALIFHESFGDGDVPEMTGTRSEATEKDRKYSKKALQIAEWLRKHHPQLKLCYGNNSSSAAFTAALMRTGFPAEYLDFIGIETPGQGCIPERLWRGSTQGTYFAEEVGRTWGRNLRTTGCYEFSARPDRLFANGQESASYYIRDALIGLCYGFETLGISGVSDASNWYPQTLWGSGSLFCRAPVLYPKPLYAAYAALTRALDRIRFQPAIRETGNLSLYVPEFERKDGKIAYAFWVPRGTVDMEFDFKNEVTGEWIDFFGKTSSVKGGKIKFTASGFPQYLVVPEKAVAVRHLKTHSPSLAGEAEFTFDSLEKFRVIRHAASLPGVRPGKFEIREVNDDEMGQCLEFKLVPEGQLHPSISEYVRLELKNPVLLKGTPDEFGFRVRGDGGWGRISFDIQDARGYRFRNFGAWADFEGNGFINFKDWFCMRYPFNGHGIKPRRVQSLGGTWSGEEGAHDPVYPVKLLAVHVILNRKVLNPARMTDAPGVIRIKDFRGIENPEFQPERN